MCKKKIKNLYFSHSKVAADMQKKSNIFIFPIIRWLQMCINKIKYFYFSHSKVAADVQKKSNIFIFPIIRWLQICKILHICSHLTMGKIKIFDFFR